MAIYIFESDIENYQSMAPVNDSFWENIAPQFNGSLSLEDNWRELLIQPIDEDLPLGDFPDFGVSYIPVLSDKGAEVLAAELENNAELLTATCAGKRYFLVNVTTFFDDVDMNNSVFKRLSSGRVISIEKICFKSAVNTPNIFKWSHMPYGKVFVNEAFAQKLRISGMEGFKLIPCK